MKKRPGEDRVSVDATLTDHDTYLKLTLSKEQPPRLPGSYSSTYHYRWENLAKEALGRMSYTDYGDLLYPLIPVFENFARADSIDATPSTKTTTTYTYVEEPILVEDIAKRIRKHLKDEFSMMSRAKRAITDSFKKDAGEDGDIRSEGEVSLNDAFNDIINDIDIAIAGIVAYRAKRIKVIKRRKQATLESVNVSHLKWSFPNGLDIHMEGVCAQVFSLLTPFILSIQERLLAVRRYRNEGISNGDFDYEVVSSDEPMIHQKISYKIGMTLNHYMNLSKMGTGKTFSTLMVIDQRLKRKEVEYVLVICPNNACENWALNEMKKHTPHLEYAIITGSYSERMQIILNRKPGVIYITNFEAFAMKSEIQANGNNYKLPLAAVFGLVPWDMVVIDEIHKIKNPGAQRTQNILKAFRDVPYTVGMSGTINANKLYDIHPPFVFLNKGKTFNSVFNERGDATPLSLETLLEQFKKAYFTIRGSSCEPHDFTIEELRDRLEEVSVKFEKDECLDLPEKTYETRLIEMGEVQAKLYEALKNYLMAELGDIAASGGRVTLLNVFAMMAKLAEAANGWIYDDNHNLINLPENPKLDAVIDMLQDLADEDKVVIWSRFTNDLHLLHDAIRKEFGEKSVAIVHGGESCPKCDSRRRERWDINQRFNDLASPLRFLVINSAVGAHAINLVGANYEFFFSNSFVKTDRYQAQERCHRIGMRDNLTIVDFVMKDTIDEKVLEALRSWNSMSYHFLHHLGVDVSKIMPDAKQEQEAPVIIEHQSQRPGECALATIAMLSGKSLEVVRSYMTVKLGSAKAYRGTHNQISAAVEAFVPWMAVEWEDYNNQLDIAKVSMEEKHIPQTGAGSVTIRHTESKMRSHAVAFAGGYVYDPNKSKVPIEEYEKWMAFHNYRVEWVFDMPPERRQDFEDSLEQKLKAMVA
jgi:hypothetical protein